MSLLYSKNTNENVARKNMFVNFGRILERPTEPHEDFVEEMVGKIRVPVILTHLNL